MQNHCSHINKHVPVDCMLDTALEPWLQLKYLRIAGLDDLIKFASSGVYLCRAQSFRFSWWRDVSDVRVTCYFSGMMTCG